MVPTRSDVSACLSDDGVGFVPTRSDVSAEAFSQMIAMSYHAGECERWAFIMLL